MSYLDKEMTKLCSYKRSPLDNKITEIVLVMLDIRKYKDLRGVHQKVGREV